MKKISEAKQILAALGLPKSLHNDRSALTLLALCNLRKKDGWENAKAINMSVVGNKNNPKYAGILRFIADYYDVDYAENSRETIRRQTLHQLVQARIVDHNPENPRLPTNSKDNHYRITKEALSVIKSFNKKSWGSKVKRFKEKFGTLQDAYNRKQQMKKISLQWKDGVELKLSPGRHNEVQAAVLKEFATRFAQASELLYIGDTSNKELFKDEDKLKILGISLDQHGKLPDIVLYDAKKNWLFLIEAVTSHGPISPKRLLELENLLTDCRLGKIYVTAFNDFIEFRKHINNIAWETEVWLVESPDHLIHFNGDRFIGPR